MGVPINHLVPILGSYSPTVLRCPKKYGQKWGIGPVLMTD